MVGKSIAIKTRGDIPRTRTLESNLNLPPGFKEVFRCNGDAQVCDVQKYSYKNVLVETSIGDKKFYLFGELLVNVQNINEYHLISHGRSYPLPFKDLRALSVSVENVHDLFSF